MAETKLFPPKNPWGFLSVGSKLKKQEGSVMMKMF